MLEADTSSSRPSPGPSCPATGAYPSALGTWALCPSWGMQLLLFPLQDSLGVPAQTLHPPDTPAQTQGPLTPLMVQHGLSVNPREHPTHTQFGEGTDTCPQQLAPRTRAVTRGAAPDAGAEPLTHLAQASPPL